jgi:DNA-binding MarR family transcriptional regulator
MDKIEKTVQVVQVCYPRIYRACHVRHEHKRTNPFRLSARDSSILAHLDLRQPLLPSKLARHLGVAKSTLSEALKALVNHGYALRSGNDSGDRRRHGILLSPLGFQALADTSVLDAKKLRSVLRSLSPRDRESVVEGFVALAEACRRWNEKHRPEKNGPTHHE